MLNSGINQSLTGKNINQINLPIRAIAISNNALTSITIIPDGNLIMVYSIDDQI